MTPVGALEKNGSRNEVSFGSWYTDGVVGSAPDSTKWASWPCGDWVAVM